MQVLLLPNIIETITQKDYLRTKNLVNKAKAYALFLSLILVILIYFLAPIVIKILFVGGKFTISDYDNTIKLLPYYLMPIVGWGTVSVFMQPLYALKKHFQIGTLNLSIFIIAWIVTDRISKIHVALAISMGLSILLIGSSLGAEILWRINFKKLSTS